MDTADAPRPNHELARLTDLPPALRAPLPPATRPAGGRPPISPRLVLRGLARHWWQALALWVVGTAALAALVYMRFEPTYSASAWLRVEPTENSPFKESFDSQMSNYLQTQVQLITSPNVLSAAVSTPKVMALPGVRAASASGGDGETYLQNILQVSIRPGAYLIEVAATSPEPTEPETVVNAVVDAFLQADQEWSEAKNSQQLESLENYEQKLQSEVDAQENQLILLAEQAEDPSILMTPGGVREADGESVEERSQFTVDLSEYERLQRQLLEVQFAQVEADAELKSARSRAAQADPRRWIDLQVEAAFLADEHVAGLREQLRELDVRIEEYGRRIKNPADPAIRRLHAERQRLFERYQQTWADMEPALRASLSSDEVNPAGLVHQAEAKLASLQGHRETLLKQIESIEVRNRVRGVEQLKSQFIASRLSELRGMLVMVHQRVEELRFESGGTQRITVVATPRPGVPQTGKREKILAMAPLAVLGLVLGLVTLVEMRAGRVDGADGLSGRVGAEVFSVPPLPTARSRGRLEGPEGIDPKFEHFVQQLDHLRVALCGEGGQDGRGRCVLITSAVGGEGKTTLAAQLAVRCAEAGASTVLIDADLRRSTLGRLFEVPECPGLSDVLRGDATLEDTLVPISQVGGCHLLPAGSPDANPNRILRGKSFAPMLERLRRSFDVVIIDTSPVLPVPDALILGRLADGAVLATRHDQSRFPAVERANGLLAGAGIPVLGVVVNGARPSSHRFGGSSAYAAYSYRSDRIPEGDDPANS